MSTELPRPATSANDELILIFQHALPKEMRNRWYRSPDGLEDILRKGGFTDLPPKFVSKALKGNRNNCNFFGTNKYQNKGWYCFDDQNKKFSTPRDQIEAFVAAKSHEEEEDVRPTIPDNHFKSFQLNYLKKYMRGEHNSAANPSRQVRDDPALDANPATDDNASADDTIHIRLSTGSEATDSVDHSAPNELVVDTSPTKSTTTTTATSSTVTPTPKKAWENPKKKWRKGSKVNLPVDTEDGKPIGLVLSAIGKNSEAIRIAEDHARKCPGYCSLHLTKRVKRDFQVIETHSCGFCKEEYTINSAIEGDPNAKKEKGGQVSYISKLVTHSAHGTAMNVKQLGEFLDQAGCVRACDSALHKMYRRRKDIVTMVSEQQLKDNRIEHNARVRVEHGTKYDIIHIDEDGKEHILCSGTISADGAGETRAYNHRITGNQHVTVIFSLVTGKPLVQWHDQLSCVHCQRVMTKLIHGGKRFDEVTAEDLTHPGKRCYRNTKHGPSVAEEHAMEKIGRYLLIDPETGKIRPDNEAILCSQVITDGDTKGAYRLINAQAQIAPEFAGVAEYFLDIGHFVKCISGGFHNLASNNAELRGVSLLEAPRIKTMVADISRILRDYGKQMKALTESHVFMKELEENASGSKKKLDDLRAFSIKRIAAIIPHHCGVHDQCSHCDCKMLQIRSHFIAKYRTEFDSTGKEVSDKDILKLHKQDIAKEYVKASRFKGKCMSMGPVGRSLVYNEITKRLNESNIDRVALAMSSNDCENYFGMLAKFSHGKRIYFGQTDSWEVYQLLVAGIKSDDHFEDKVQASAGIMSSYIRDVATARLVKQKQYHKARKKTEACKSRRKLSQIAKVKNAVKNSTAAARHKPNKLNPTTSCKSKVKKDSTAAPKKQTRKRKAKCPNCKQTHTGPCQEPEYDTTKKKKTKKQKQMEEKESKLEDAYKNLFG